MKSTPFQLFLSAALLSCVFFIACKKEVSVDPSLIAEGRGNHGNGNGGNTTAGTASGTCYFSQGYWFGSGKHTWPDVNGGTVTGVITIGGTGSATYNYTQQQGLDIWRSSNAGGKKDAKKAFVLLATIQLSGATITPTYTGYQTDLMTVQNWLSGMGQLNASNLPSAKMPSNVKEAYNRLKNWVENHECGDDDEHDGDDDDDDDDDKVCTTDTKNWFGSHAQTWPDVNGSTAGNFTINGGTASTTHTYTQTEATAVYNLFLAKKTDAQRVFLLLAAWKLSQSTMTTYSGFNTDVATLETWLGSLGKLSATNNPTTAMPSNVKAAYNRITAWIEDHDCD